MANLPAVTPKEASETLKSAGRVHPLAFSSSFDVLATSRPAQGSNFNFNMKDGHKA